MPAPTTGVNGVQFRVMDINAMSNGQRVWWLMVMPVLAGLGVYQLISWLPDPLYLVAIMVLVVFALIWTIRQLLWTRRVQAEMAEELEELDATLERMRHP